MIDVTLRRFVASTLCESIILVLRILPILTLIKDEVRKSGILFGSSQENLPIKFGKE